MKVCVIVLAGLLATLILRKRSAAIRHWVLATTMVCAMLMPALEMLVPAWHLAASKPTLVRVPTAVSVNEAFSLPIGTTATAAASTLSLDGVPTLV